MQPGVFRVLVERQAPEGAALRFEWLDRVAPSRPRLQAQATRRGRVRLSWAADGQKLYDATATPEKRLELVPGSLHGVFLVAGSTRARTLLQRFIRDPGGSVP